MDSAAAGRGASGEPRDGAGAVDLLSGVPLDRLEQAVIALRGQRSPEEARRAMVERIARAPSADFEALKHIYLKHCGAAK